ncbi:protein NOI4-like isoform X2 [Syzygium oleosum]|uniref:protein NOI4-like isoform X2 n=1 Tax=Syzygium oleosum TaxID=219896 RepID=UPI0011D27746|nr:protein NOI4-like isoform X2 [Syzygium oleosum]
MAAAGRPLPKFGEWDVNNPASAEGFTVIFNKARDEKKTSGTAANMVSPRRNVSPQRNNSTYNKNEKRQQSSKRKWLCCG